MSHANVLEWIIAAREGSRPALDSLLTYYHPFLLSIAKQTVPAQLAGKVSPSSIVQQTCLEAAQAIQNLRAQTELECSTWLREILRTNVLDATRRYLRTEKRELRRELPDATGGSNPLLEQLISSVTTPEAEAMAREDSERLDAALARLPEQTRQVIQFHSRDHLSFVEIGLRVGKAPDAVRMMWNRGVKQLATELSRERYQ